MVCHYASQGIKSDGAGVSGNCYCNRGGFARDSCCGRGNCASCAQAHTADYPDYGTNQGGFRGRFHGTGGGEQHQ